MSAALSLVQGLTGLLTAKWLGASDRGIIVLAWSISSLLLLVSNFGIINSARVVFGDARRPMSFPSYLRHTTRLTITVAVPLMVVSVLSLALTSRTRDVAVLTIFAVYCTLMLVGALLREALHGLGKHSSAVFTDLLSAAIQFGGAAVLHYQGRLSVLSMLVFGLIGVSAQVILGVILGLRAPRPEHDAGITFGELLRFSLPAVGLTLGQWVAWRGDRLVVGAVGGTAEAGIYGTISTLADIPWIIPGAVGAILTNRVSRQVDFTLIHRYRRATVAATAAASIGVTALSIPLILYFLKGEFVRGIPALLILVPATIVLTSAQLDLAACLGLKDLKSSARSCLAGAATLLIVCVPLIARFGATGAALSSLAAYCVMALTARRALLSHHPDRISAADSGGRSDG